MQSYEHLAGDGHPVRCYRWLPEDGNVVRIIQIAHGMGEHAARYDEFATRLAGAGNLVVASDHRGHGGTAVTLGDFGTDGWNRILEDIYEINRSLVSEHPGKPIVLFGHSMGAMLTQHYLCRHGDTLDAVILSGSPGFSPRLRSLIIRFICRIEAWRLGPRANSDLMQSLLFGHANESFDGPGASGFEWLSRDTAEVQKYVDDPGCGFVPCCQSLLEVFRGAARSASMNHIVNIPKLPILLFSGTEDPVHDELKNINRLLERYKRAGLSVTTKFYEGGRHEMLNETNRQEVIEDVLAWLDSSGRKHAAGV